MHCQARHSPAGECVGQQGRPTLEKLLGPLLLACLVLGGATSARVQAAASHPVAERKGSSQAAASSRPKATAGSKVQRQQVAVKAKATSSASKAKPVAKARPMANPKQRVKRTLQANRAASPRPLAAARAAPAPLRLSHAQLAGLHTSTDSLELKSAVALVIDQETQEVLYSKNDQAVLPIASLTKLMTAIVVREAQLPDEEVITITQADVDTEKGSVSRLRVGTRLTRAELMHLSLMSSENRAAHALGRSFPGGMDEFVKRMNFKARQLGMNDTRYVEPTGLSSANQSSAHDLATLVTVAALDPVLRDFSTSHGYQVEVGKRVVQYNNTNRLVKHPDWDIGLQKTGYISEAGRCLVMQVRVAGRQLIMVFLDSAGKLSRLGDAERVRRWVEHNGRSETQPVLEPVKG